MVLTRLVAVSLVPVLLFAQTPAPPPTLTTLTPGEGRLIAQRLPVQFVFVGWETGSAPDRLDPEQFRSMLPTYSVPFVLASFGTANPGIIPLLFTYEHRVVDAPSQFEDAFFGYLTSIARPAPLTQQQVLYNGQQARSRTIESNVEIDAPAVERWLAANAGPMLGIDTRQYTVFFVNWFGRPDFVHHVFTKYGEPDADTGFDHGTRDAHKRIAWGGSAADDPETGLGSVRRIWFHDLSAGPDGRTNNWNLDDAELGYPLGFPDGIPDYRIPPSWEYGNAAGWRPFDSATVDLALLARFVAIDLLFTHASLYGPILPGPGILLPDDIELDVTRFEMNPSDAPPDRYALPAVLARLGRLQPWASFSSEESGAIPSARLEEILRCTFAGKEFPFGTGSCVGARQFGWYPADLQAWFLDHRMQYLDGSAGYELPVFYFNLPPDLADIAWAIGYAEGGVSDHLYQSQVYLFDLPLLRELNMGMTQTMTHEAGHHLALAHPHDGGDIEAEVLFSPVNAFYFAWTGDESSSVMSYYRDEDDFGQFDLDNMNRFLTGSQINLANAILGEVYEHPRAGEEAGTILTADVYARIALIEYQRMNYEAAARYSRVAAKLVISLAERLGAVAWQGSYRRDIDRRPGLRALLREYYSAAGASDPRAFVRTTRPLDAFLAEMGENEGP